jgi:hypothetical protein
MKQSLRQLLYEHFDITVTKVHLARMRQYATEFEIRQSHMEALNSPLLGVSKMYFLPKDNMGLFNVFDIDASAFKRVAHSAASIDTTRFVTSDIYNLLVIWLAHKARESSLSVKDKEDLQVLLFKMLHYKFFTSIVNHQMPYGTDEETMRYTIDNLNGKFYIKQKETPTWFAVIEARSRDVVGESSIHNNTIKTFSPDEKVLYVVTDIQTRLRKQLLTIFDKFRENKRLGNKVSSSSIVADIGGEKMIKPIASVLDSVSNTVVSSALNLNEFVDYEMVDVIVALTKNIKADAMNALLVKFSEMATNQQKTGNATLVKGSGDRMVLVGYRVLVSNILQKTYRACMLDKSVNLGSKVDILNKTKTLYSSSRIGDKDILIVKNSVDYFVNTHSNSQRTSTNASLKIAFIIYIILLSFKHM